MAQTTFSAKEAKNNFGRLLDEARIGPVSIEKNGRKVAVLLSTKEYNKFEEMEDAIWIKKAKEAAKEGFLSASESVKFIQNILNE
jgi:antitoxin Phd